MENYSVNIEWTQVVGIFVQWFFCNIFYLLLIKSSSHLMAWSSCPFVDLCCWFRNLYIFLWSQVFYQACHWCQILWSCFKTICTTFKKSCIYAYVTALCLSSEISQFRILRQLSLQCTVTVTSSGGQENSFQLCCIFKCAQSNIR